MILENQPEFLPITGKLYSWYEVLHILKNTRERSMRASIESWPNDTFVATRTDSYGELVVRVYEGKMPSGMPIYLAELDDFLPNFGEYTNTRALFPVWKIEPISNEFQLR